MWSGSFFELERSDGNTVPNFHLWLSFLCSLSIFQDKCSCWSFLWLGSLPLRCLLPFGCWSPLVRLLELRLNHSQPNKRCSGRGVWWKMGFWRISVSAFWWAMFQHHPRFFLDSRVCWRYAIGVVVEEKRDFGCSVTGLWTAPRMDPSVFILLKQHNFQPRSEGRVISNDSITTWLRVWPKTLRAQSVNTRWKPKGGIGGIAACRHQRGIAAKPSPQMRRNRVKILVAIETHNFRKRNWNMAWFGGNLGIDLSSYLRFYLFACLFACLPACLPVYLIYLSTCLSFSIYLYLFLSISIYFCLSVCLSIDLFISFYLSTYLSISVSIYLSTYLSI